MASKNRQPASESTYVVQAAQESGLWKDLATVTVPGKTHRLRVIEQALKDANVKLPAEGLEVRVLDERSAAQVNVRLHRPEPELRIG